MSDRSQIKEIAAYMNMNQNPSLQIGIDGSMDPRGSDPRDQGLSDRRGNAVHDLGDRPACVPPAPG